MWVGASAGECKSHGSAVADKEVKGVVECESRCFVRPGVKGGVEWVSAVTFIGLLKLKRKGEKKKYCGVLSHLHRPLETKTSEGDFFFIFLP